MKEEGIANFGGLSKNKKKVYMQRGKVDKYTQNMKKQTEIIGRFIFCPLQRWIFSIHLLEFVCISNWVRVFASFISKFSKREPFKLGSTVPLSCDDGGRVCVWVVGK